MSSGKLKFDSLCKSIANSLQIGFISFDPSFRIMDYTPPAKELIYLGNRIDESIAAGTDPNVWNNWTGLLESSLQSGKKAEFGTVKYVRQEQTRLLNITCIPITNDNSSSAIGGAIFVSDITEKLDIEHELAHAERLISIGKVAGKVAHELNNPLDGILRYVNLSIRTIEQNQPKKAVNYLAHCREGLGRMSQIITELLEFSRSTHLAFEKCSVDKLIDDALRTLEIHLRNIDVQVIRDYHSPVPHMKSDALFQVFCNLIKNAADAMQGSGQLTITIRQNNQNWTIEFLDSGPGLDPRHIEDLFKPFYTTKPHGRGTGLGLAICKDILSKLNSTIMAQNGPEGGGLFTIYLPSEPNKHTGIKNV